MPRTLIKPKGLWQPKFTYTYGSIVEGGKTIYLAGAIAVDKKGNVVGRGDLKAQIRQVMENIRIALDEAGATLKDIVFKRMYCTDGDAYVALAPWLRENYPEVFGTSPTSYDAVPGTLVYVHKLGYDGMIEIEVIAHIP
ncbi:MAG: aminoacrylate peracid reductase [Dehalococcoidia bacterium]|nr:aminoacrylate peracid reductase [Dehalococcoidia bacterium]